MEQIKAATKEKLIIFEYQFKSKIILAHHRQMESTVKVLKDKQNI